MKLLFYCDTIFSFGGVQRVLAVVATRLSANHDVTILTLDDPSSEDKTMYDLEQYPVKFDYIRYSGIPWYEYYPCKAYSYSYKKWLPHTRLASDGYAKSSFPPVYQKQLARKINSGQYDLVIGVHAFLSFHLASVSKRIRAKTIGWMHNSYQAFFEMHPAYLEGLKNHFKYQMTKLSALVVLTRADRELYREQLGLNSEAIYNPLTVTATGKGSADFKRFIAVGRFAPRHKGFDILIHAFSRFARVNSDWTLEIVGEGEEEALYRSLIEQYGLEERITVSPFTKQIETHYASSSIYILSSRWEGFGLVQVEAMAHRLPVISSDLPIAKELFEGHGCVITFRSEDPEDLAEKMLYMAGTADWKEMSRQAFAFSQTFSVEKIVAQWEELFARL